MPFTFFGYQLKKKAEPELAVLSPPQHDDGAVNVETGAGAYGTYVDLDGLVKTEAELITRYRGMSLQPEIDHAVDEIVNEAVVVEEDQPVVEIVLDDVKDMPQSIKKRVEEEFDETMKLLNFENNGWETFKKWYIDGRRYYHAVIDKDNLKDGIKELRYIDPRRIRKIREVKRERVGQGPQAVEVTREVREYYLYNERGFDNRSAGQVTGMSTTLTGLKIAKDAIVYVPSGVTDEYGRMVLSHLHKAIKCMNQLRAEEDACVIYRLARAPERRIFYIDVGNLPKMKAEQYLRDIMVKFKNRLVYDASTGEIRDDRKFMTMLEDFWLPRREGGRGTQIENLPAGENLGEMRDVEYFQKRLYKSLNVPIGRLLPEDTYVVGMTTEITRDEVKFSKFIDKLRTRFTDLFLQVLRIQLALKNIMGPDEWDKYKIQVKFRWARDNYFAELKEDQIRNNRMQTVGLMLPFVGKYYSHDYIRKHVLRQTEDEIKEQDKLINQEMNDPKYADQIGLGPDGQDDPMTTLQQAPMPKAPAPGKPKTIAARRSEP